MSGELALREAAYSVAQVVEQREVIESAMKNAMTVGMHYGKIAGCGDKPTLLQPGAQILAFMFKLRPDYVVFEKDLPGDHREYRVTCKIYHQGSGLEVGQGVGICTTMESKYRFRNAAKEVTWFEDTVPPAYWTLHRKAKEGSDDDKAQLHRWLSTVFENMPVADIGTKKDDRGVWRFVQFHGGEGKVENPNISDLFNTVLKIGKKRAFVDAVITATASNDFFTQDLEDIAENMKSVDVVTSADIAHMKKDMFPDAPGEGKKAEAGEPAKTTKEPSKPAPKKEPAPGEMNDWKSVRVHFGSDSSKIKNRPLSELSQTTIDWLNKQMEKKANHSAQDKILIAALALQKAEIEAKGEKTGKNLEMLRAKCEAMKIALAAVTEVNHELGSTALTFTQIQDDEAKYFLDHWDATSKRAVEIMELGNTLPM